MKLLSVFLLTSTLLATEGLDLLMKDKKVAPSTTNTVMSLDDPFMMQFFTKYQQTQGHHYLVHKWATHLFNKEYKAASHMITLIEPHISATMNEIFQVSKLYLYWKLDLPQVFFNEWLELVSADKSLFQNPSYLGLDAMIAKDSMNWFVEEGIVLTNFALEKLKTLEDIQSSFFNNEAQFVAALRTGQNTLTWLTRAPKNHPLRFQLAQTAILSLVKEGKTSLAAKLLKKEIEPQIVESENVDEISNYYLLLARLLYQIKAFDASLAYYRKIPEESKHFLSSRIEAAWILLRNNNMSELKGELVSLKSNAFEKQFFPDYYLIASIANLKLCHFDEANRIFNNYIKDNKEWASIIKENISSTNPEVVNNDDFYMKLALKRSRSLQENFRQIKTLAKESIEAIVPSIGIQKHWEEQLTGLKRMSSDAEKQIINEKRRSWYNRQMILEENIKKMSFVKIEFLSLMRKMAKYKDVQSDEVTVYQSSSKKTDDLEFPFDGVPFGDELFNMKATTRSLCLQGKL